MSYKINGNEYDFWSCKNQRILDKLVEREIYCCMTSEMEFMLGLVLNGADDDNPFCEDDLNQTILPYCPECHSTYGFDELTTGEMKDSEFEIDTGVNDNTGEQESECLCPVCGIGYKTIKEARECCGEDEELYRCENCGKILSEYEYQTLDYEPQEIYEWWAVSVWFGEKLAEQGCVVIESYGKSYWGRCATGQSISLDGCIANIAFDMKILDGMENDWERSTLE